LLTRSLGQREPEVARYIHRTPGGVQAAGCIYPLKICVAGLAFVNPELLGFLAVASAARSKMQESVAGQQRS